MDTRILTPHEIDDALGSLKPRHPKASPVPALLLALLVVEIIGVAAFLAWWTL